MECVDFVHFYHISSAFSISAATDSVGQIIVRQFLQKRINLVAKEVIRVFTPSISLGKVKSTLSTSKPLTHVIRHLGLCTFLNGRKTSSENETFETVRWPMDHGDGPL